MALAHLGQLGQLGLSSSLGHFTNNASVIPVQSTPYSRPHTLTYQYDVDNVDNINPFRSAYNRLKTTYKDRVTEATKPEILESINTIISNFKHELSSAQQI